jgi:hypothetical protein
MTHGNRNPFLLQSRHKGLVKCPHCGQKFNRQMIKIHEPICQARSTKNGPN